MNIDAEVARQAQQRFLRGLMCTCVDEAVSSGLRTLEQWNACLDSARTHVLHIARNERRRRFGERPNTLAARVLHLLADGEPHTADILARTLEANPDVIRRALKKYRERGALSAEERYNREHPRAFQITEHGRHLLQRFHVTGQA
jgi:DNA-binding transcriptional ArsR family regulator